MVRREALEVVKEARTCGNLSEDFEYKTAKQDKDKNESRIRYLEKMIKTARIISNNSREGEVSLEDTVEVYIPNNDETGRYRLVTTIRGSSLQRLVSIDSPLGKAIGGCKMGDKVYVKVGDHFGCDVEIRSIGKTTEDNEGKLCSY